MSECYKFTAQADKNKPARLDLFGEIGGGFWSDGFDETTFSEAMKAVQETQPLDVFLNSQGGSVFAAMAIRSLLGAHKGAVTITVAGLAASAATIITCAKGARVVMPKGSMMLVHPVRLSVGSMTAEEMKVAVENLEKVSNSVLDIYEEKTGQKRKTLCEMMGKETFLTATEAVDLGFADVYDDSVSVEIQNKATVVNVAGLALPRSLFNGAPAGFLDNPKEEVKPMDYKQLKAEFPEVFDEIRNEGFQAGVEAERARIKAIEDIAPTGCGDLVFSAKYENPMSAEQLAVAVLKAEKARKATELASISKDAEVLNDLGDGGNFGSRDTKKEEESRAVDHLAEICKYGG